MELMTLISWLSDFVGWDDGSGDFVGWDDGSGDSVGWVDGYGDSVGWHDGSQWAQDLLSTNQEHYFSRYTRFTCSGNPIYMIKIFWAYFFLACNSENSSKNRVYLLK